MAFDVFSIEKGISVIRVKSLYLSSANYIIRGISQLFLPYFFWKNIKKFVKQKIDAVIVYTPPLSLSILGNIFKRKFGAKYLLNVQDIFPQNAIDLGVMKNKISIKFFEYMEKKAYEAADEITSHTKTSRRFLIEEKKISPDRIHLIPNWIDVDPYVNVARKDSFRKRYGLLEHKFIFLFAGVIGPSQGLDLIIKAADDVKNIFRDICFLIVGDGLEKDRLMKMVKEYSLTNVVFQPWVPLGEYPKLVKSADVGIVCLSSMNRTPVVPAKILGYMAASIPVVAFLQKESDGHDIIKESGCGYSIVSNASQGEISNLIIKVYRERGKLKQHGVNGLRYVSKHFSKDVCIDNLIKLLE